MRPTKRIPTILALFVVILIIVFVGFFFEGITRNKTSASSSIEPKQVMITNITNASFTVSWQTDEAATGTLLITDSNGKKLSAFDERDTTGTMGKYLTHSITVRSLTSSSAYSVTILSNGKKFPTDQPPYSITTFPNISPSTSPFDPAFGSVKMPSGQGADGVLVYLTIDGGQTLSTLSKPSGSWIIPLSQIRTQDGAAFIAAQERMDETIVFQFNNQKAQVTTDTLNDSPVSEVILGQTYDFRGKDAKKTTPQTIANNEPNLTISKQTVLGETTDKQTGSVVFVAPREGATLSSTRPLISGVGIVGATVTITMGTIQPMVGTTTVASDGTWKYTPSQPMAPGKQSITITTTDGKKKPVAITHTVTILKSGSQVLGDATPSATLEATISATPIPTVTLASTDSADLTLDDMPTSGSFLPTILMILLGSMLFLGGGATLIRQ